MDRVIFLDIDGVLNSKFWDNSHSHEISEGKLVDLDKVKLFADLVKRTDSKVILHSGWRMWFDEDMKPLRHEAEFLVTALKNEGVHILGVTPDLTTEEMRRTKKFSLVKAQEILTWLKDNSSFTKWIVIDDLDLHNDEIRSHQIQTDAEFGLLEEDVENAVKMLA